MFRTFLIINFLLIFQSTSHSQLISTINNSNYLDSELSSSPYFLIQSDSSNIESFPLLETSADVSIDGVIADVRVTQKYKNDGEKPIEAVYVFPASNKAAVYAMTMTIGDRVLKAEINKKEEAKKIYEQARNEGRSASLLEQERPNVFKINVANILPGDLIKVELSYTELLVPEKGEYSFIYPTVVGPRYQSKDEQASGDNSSFTSNPHQHQGESPKYNFDLKIDLKTPIPIWGAQCKTHELYIKFIDEYNTKARLKESESKGGNKDFIFNYKLMGDQIETGVLLMEGEKENYFLMMLQAPKSTKPKEIPPREYIMILDVSGSMNGFPLTIAKKTLIKILKNLKETDKFNIMLFAGASEMISPQSVNANQENLTKAIDFLSNNRGGGGTEILPALKKALNLKHDKNISRSFVVLTDGYVSVEPETFDLIRNNLGEANLFSFGIGSSVNRHIIEGMAHAGQGEPFVVTDLKESGETVDRFVEYVSNPVMTNIEVEFNGFMAYDIEPKQVPDLMADRPILVWGKYEGLPKGEIIVKGYTNEEIGVRVDLRKFARKSNSNALKYLWARKRIEVLSDFSGPNPSDKIVEEVTKLGLDYALLTKYTSFVATDYKKRSDGTYEKVKQPLPMPEGVSDDAIAFGLASGNISQMKIAPSIRKGLGVVERKSVRVKAGSYSAEYDGRVEESLSRLEDRLNGNKDPHLKLIDSVNSLVYDEAGSYDKKKLYENLEYPVDMMVREVESNEEVWVNVSKDGNIKKVESDKQWPGKFFASAQKAIMKTKFTPAKINGVFVDTWMKVIVDFKLFEGNIKFDVNGKNYEAYQELNGFAYNLVNQTNGRTPKIGDEVVLEINQLNGNASTGEQKLKVIIGIQELISVLDEKVLKMKEGEVQLFVVPKPLLYERLPNFKVNDLDKIIFTLKLTEILE